MSNIQSSVDYADCAIHTQVISVRYDDNKALLLRNLSRTCLHQLPMLFKYVEIKWINIT